MDHASRKLAWLIGKNTASQFLGRILLSAIRFGVAILIFRLSGVDRLGEYALLISLMLIAEWLTDFGTTDIAVRNLAQRTDGKSKMLSSLVACKLIQITLATVWLASMPFLLGLNESMTRAAMIGCIGIVCYGGVLLLRTLFRVNMVMERDIGAELLSMLVFLPAVTVACYLSGAIEWIVASYVLSRVVFLLLALGFGWRAVRQVSFSFSLRGCGRLLRMAWPIGLSGLLVAAYETSDLVLLSVLASEAEAGLFMPAMRIIGLVTLAIGAVSLSAFPVLAAVWESDRERFQRIHLAVLRAAIVLGGAAGIAMYLAAPMISLIFGSGSEAMIPVLRLMACVVVFKVTVAALAPLVVIAGRQLHVIWLTALVLAVKIALLTWLIPLWGAAGAATANVITEIAVNLVPTILVVRMLLGARIAWGTLIGVAFGSVGIVLLTYYLGYEDSIVGVLIACVLYTSLVLGGGFVKLDDIRMMLSSVLSQISGSDEPHREHGALRAAATDVGEMAAPYDSTSEREGKR